MSSRCTQGHPPSHYVQGVQLHCISEVTLCINWLCKEGKIIFNRKESYYSEIKNRRKWSFRSWCMDQHKKLLSQRLSPLPLIHPHCPPPQPSSLVVKKERKAQCFTTDCFINDCGPRTKFLFLNAIDIWTFDFFVEGEAQFCALQGTQQYLWPHPQDATSIPSTEDNHKCLKAQPNFLWYPESHLAEVHFW